MKKKINYEKKRKEYTMYYCNTHLLPKMKGNMKKIKIGEGLYADVINPAIIISEEIIIGEQQEINRLEKENAELKERLKSEANEIIKDLLYCTDGIVEVSIPEENRFLSVKKLKARAEKFLKEACE